MDTFKNQTSALDIARAARKAHASLEGSYREGLYNVIVDIVRTVRALKNDKSSIEKFVNEPFFEGKEKERGRKRDWSNLYNLAAIYIGDADTRKKEQTTNTYGIVARYYDKKVTEPVEIPKLLHDAGGIKEVVKLAAAEQVHKVPPFEEETWNDLVALKIWVTPKQRDSAMKVTSRHKGTIDFSRIDGPTEFKEFAALKLKRRKMKIKS